MISGTAVTINNADTSLTGGISDTSPGTTTLMQFTSITDGGSLTITNGSAISATPTLNITSPIDLNGNALKEASGAGGASDTGLTLLSGVISSSVPTTDSIVQNGGGQLWLSAANTFDGPVNVTKGVLVDAGNQSLGALTGAGTTVSGGAALGISGGDNAAYTNGVTLAAGSSIIKVDTTSPTVAFPITMTGDATIQSHTSGSVNFNGTVNLGTFNLTFDNGLFNAGSVIFMNGALSSSAGATITKIGGNRVKLAHDNSGFMVTININAGILSAAANNALGTGANKVTVASGATLSFQGGINYTAPQTVTISGPGADIGGGPIGAISNIDGNNTFTGTIALASGSDESIGSTGGQLTLGQPITLTSNNLVLQGSGGALVLNGIITGGAGTSIIKNGTSTATLTANNKTTFTGSTTINAGLLSVSSGTLGGGSAPITVKSGSGLGLNAADLGTVPVILAGGGTSGGGAVENISGTSHIGGTVTLTGSTTFGSDAGTLTIDKDIAGADNLLTFTGSGNMIFNGAISGGKTAHGAGLLETQGGSWDTSPYNPPPIGTDSTAPGNPSLGSDFQLYPFMAETSGNENALIATTNHRWGTNNTWYYTGTINFPNDPKTPGSGTLSFAKSIDDGTLLRIDGVTYINDTNWQNALGTGGIELAAGPHIFDLRIANGGGAGAVDSNNVTSGFKGLTTSMGFVYRVDSGTTDPKANSKNADDYVIPMDPGDGSLFSVNLPNVLTKSGSGSVTLNGNNTYQEATLITGGTLVAGNNNALGSTSKVTVQSGGALVLPAAGGLTIPASVPVFIAGNGPAGAGAIESLGGTSTINSKINLTDAAAIAADAGTLTLAGTVDIGDGVITYTGAGNINVTGQMSSRAAGLLEGQANVANSPTAPIDPQFGTDIQLGTTIAQTNAFTNSKIAFPTTQHTWASTDTWIYTGTIFWPSDPATPGSGTMSFAKDVDGSTFLKIDGVTYINNVNWATPVGTGPITLKSGPHSFEARFGNSVGGAGPGPGPIDDYYGYNGWTGWTSNIGFIFRVDHGPGANDPLANSTNVSDYFQSTPAYAGAPKGGLPVDPGDGSLFQTTGPSGVVKSGPGTVTLAPVNPFVGPTTINGGKLVIKDEGSLGAGGISNNVSSVTINGGTLETTASYTAIDNYFVNGATSAIMVDPGQTLTDGTFLRGSGTLNKTGAGTLVLTAANTYTGGTVVSAGTLVAKSGQALGSGPVTLAGGILSVDTTGALTVTSLTPTPTGFTATFNKPFNPADLALYGTGLHTLQDVTLVGAKVGAVTGSLIIDPSNMSITFKATANSLSLLDGFGSVVLPDDTYTVTLVSGSGSGGFQDALGAGLDGTSSGGHANYTTTFTTNYQAKATPVLAIPDFARGPDGTRAIKVPNDSPGIPITLYNASRVTDVTFTLSYDPSLLTVTGGTNGDATDPASSFTLVGSPSIIDTTHATANFHFSNTTAQSGTVVLGDIVANVPNSAAANYKAKEVLQLGNIVINQGAISGAVSAGGIHVNAYLGDVTGNGTIDGLDVATAFNVAQGKDTGFAAYPLLDPAIVGDVALDYSVDAGDISDLAAFTVHLPTPLIPAPPGGLTIMP